MRFRTNRKRPRFKHPGCGSERRGFVVTEMKRASLFVHLSARSRQSPHELARRRWVDKRKNGPSAIDGCGFFAMLAWLKRWIERGFSTTARVPFKAPPVEEIVANIKRVLADVPPAPTFEEPSSHAVDAMASHFTIRGSLKP